MKIMIVDDEPDMRLIVGAILRRSGYQIVEVGDPLQVLETARRERPDLIMMDVLMEGEDGPEVLVRLRADPATSDIPVIFVTGRGDAEESARLTGLGALGVIAKPIAPKSLVAQVRAMLGQ